MYNSSHSPLTECVDGVRPQPFFMSSCSGVGCQPVNTSKNGSEGKHALLFLFSIQFSNYNANNLPQKQSTVSSTREATPNFL